MCLNRTRKRALVQDGDVMHWVQRAGMVVWIILTLAACTISNPFLQAPRGLAPHEQWAIDMMQGEYAQAEPRMAVDNFEEWRMATDDLRLAYGGLKSIEQTNALEDSVSSRRFRFTFNDGFQRCLRIKIVEQGQVVPLDPNYQECAADAFLPPNP